jgi:glycosyltransferase involved in cell wall biosynthesis
MRVLYFGTYERLYPRNAQVIAALRGAGVEVFERHVPVWEGRAHKWRAGARSMARLAVAEARLFRRPREDFDAVIVGYPGHLDLAAARRVAGPRPVVFNPLVSLYDTFVADRGRFRPRSPAGRALRAIDRRALRAADLVVADTAANGDFLAELGGISRGKVEVCFVGAEERVFAPGWKPKPGQPFEALFVGKLIPLHGLATVLEAARLAAEVRFKVVGSGQLEPLLREPPPNVEHVPWVDYERLRPELHAAGCALGVFGTSDKARRVIPNKVFQALACGVPVITADTPAACELLADGQSALLVPPDEAEALAAAVVRFADDTALARRIAHEGLRAYRAQASERVLGERWRTLIEGVLR